MMMVRLCVLAALLSVAATQDEVSIEGIKATETY